MASWYNSIVSTASSNITKLQRTYFAGETDGDTEDDTHVCRVLRNYYVTEKGQALPKWLPPDPKAPPPAQPVLANPQQNSRYGNFNSQQQGGGQLSSLWDNGGGRGQQQQQQQGGYNAGNRNPFAASGGGQPDPRQGIPQSLRAGSYQSASGRVEGVSSPTQSANGAQTGVSAQEKLKQRFFGGARTTSPNSGGPFQPPAQQQAPAPQQSTGGGSRWGASWGAGQGAAANESGYGRRNDQPVMSANAPWADGGFDYPAGGGGGGGGGGRSYGLPSGPRGGLPSGPRPR